MDCGLFGVRFLFLGHKNGAAAPVDYLSAFATAPDIKLYMEWKRKFEKEDQKNVPVTEVGIANSTAPIYPGATWYSSKTMTNSPWLLK